MIKSATHVPAVFAAALVVFTFSGSALAEHTPEQQWACASDAFRYCSCEIPGVERVTACMIRSVKELSPLCRAQFK